MHIFNREACKSVPFIAEVLDPELQEALSRPLPSSADGLTLVWDHGQDISEVAMPRRTEHLRPVLQRIVAVGDVVPRSEDDFLMIAVNQRAANTLSPKLSWHIDDFGVEYKRAVVSDVFGPRYKTQRGRVRHTPNYGVLVLDASVVHAPHKSRDASIRTRLLASRMAITDRPYYASEFYTRSVSHTA